MTAPAARDGSAATAVLAGCGDLGLRVGLRLSRAGYRVLGLRRRPEALPGPIRAQAVDLRREVPVLPSDTRVVVVALTADGRTEQAYRDTYLGGLRHVLDAIEQHVPDSPRVVLVSSTSVYGVTDGGWVDENTMAEPRSATGAVLREAEELLHARLSGGVVLRLGGLYGAGRGALLDSVRTGTAVLPQTPVYTNRIHRDDAAAAIEHLISRTPRPERIYLGVDDDPAERGELLRFLADELGVPHPPVDTAPPRSQGKRCRNDRLRATGFEFRYPDYREGYRAIIGAAPSS